MLFYTFLERIRTHPLVEKKPWVLQFIKFSMVGTSGAIVDFSILNVLIYLLHTNVHIAAAISFICAVINNFFWNKYWTFRGINVERNLSFQLVQFVMVSLVGLLIRAPVVYVLVEYLKLWHNWAVAIAIIMVLTWNFLANKLWTFKPVPKR